MKLEIVETYNHEAFRELAERLQYDIEMSRTDRIHLRLEHLPTIFDFFGEENAYITNENFEDWKRWKFKQLRFLLRLNSGRLWNFRNE